ncbi:MAG: hypothetical protein MJ103_07510 [Saccharofermentans sp.]|nr:hypothetical protein [Saccharofermentans sp.]
MKNVTKKEIALIVITIAVIALEAVSVYALFTKGTPIHWSQFSIAFSALTIAFCSLSKKKKAQKKIEEAVN